MAYSRLLSTSIDPETERTAVIERHGPYEVRFTVSLKEQKAEAYWFWIELFDHQTQMSLDGFGADNLKRLSHAAADFIADAEQLHRGSPSDSEESDDSSYSSISIPSK
jgi:hypothetical protein